MAFDISSDGGAILNASASDLEHMMTLAFESRINSFGRNLTCYSPTVYPYKIRDHQHTSSHTFTSLSVTGTSCALGCEHCKGRLLKGMESTTSPETLLERCRELASRGAKGVLISGGSDARGHVPLLEFGDAIKEVKDTLGLTVVVHTGLVDEQTVHILKEARIEAAMLDIIGDEAVARDVYHIENGPEKMRRSLELLKANEVPTVPHVLVGLNYGRPAGELNALQMISENSPAAVVIIALSPVRNTPMADARPPPPELIGRVLTVTRLALRNTPVLLGCARPIGQHKIDTDKYAISSGVNGVAYISQEGADFARSKRLNPIFVDECCSLAFLSLL